MNVFEIILIVAGLLALAIVGFIAYQAKHNGVTIAAQAKTDLAEAKTAAATDIAAAKAEATALAHDLEVRVVALETKLGLIGQVKVSVTPTPVAAPAGNA